MSSGLRESSTMTADPNKPDGRFTGTAVMLSATFTRLAALVFTGLHFYELLADGAYTKLVVIALIIAPPMAIAAWLLVRSRRTQGRLSVRGLIETLPVKPTADEDDER